MSYRDFFIVMVTFMLIIGIITGMLIHQFVYEKYNTEFNKYDVNEDGTVNILDAVTILNYIKAGE